MADFVDADLDADSFPGRCIRVQSNLPFHTDVAAIANAYVYKCAMTS